MGDRIQVKCIDRRMWGSQVYGQPSGAIYRIVDGGDLHVMLANNAVDSESGVLPSDVEEFSTLSQFMVPGAKRVPPPPPKKRPAPAGGSSDTDSGEAPPDPDADDLEGEDQEGPPASLVDRLPAPEASKKVWLNWARSNGIALSAAQKKLGTEEVKDVITNLAEEKDAATAAD